MWGWQQQQPQQPQPGQAGGYGSVGPQLPPGAGGGAHGGARGPAGAPRGPPMRGGAVGAPPMRQMQGLSEAGGQYAPAPTKATMEANAAGSAFGGGGNMRGPPGQLGAMGAQPPFNMQGGAMPRGPPQHAPGFAQAQPPFGAPQQPQRGGPPHGGRGNAGPQPTRMFRPPVNPMTEALNSQLASRLGGGGGGGGGGGAPPMSAGMPARRGPPPARRGAGPPGPGRRGSVPMPAPARRGPPVSPRRNTGAPAPTPMLSGPPPVVVRRNTGSNLSTGAAPPPTGAASNGNMSTSSASAGGSNESLDQYPFYESGASRDTSNAKLADAEPGTFILRPSRREGCMALSVRTLEDGVQHTVVNHTDEGWYVTIGDVQSLSYPKVLDLLRALTPYVKLLPPWNDEPIEEGGQYGVLSLVIGAKQVKVADEYADSNTFPSPPGWAQGAAT